MYFTYTKIRVSLTTTQDYVALRTSQRTKQDMSRIDTAVVSVFIGGQLEIQNLQEGYLFRGEVESAEVAGNSLRVTFKWLAKACGELPQINGWVVEERKDYEANVLHFSVAPDIGPCADDCPRLCLDNQITGETLVFYSPNGSRLDPDRVEGLVQS